MKRLIAFLLTLALLCSLVVVTKAESQAVIQAKALIAALPQGDLPTDPNSDEFAALLAAAKEAIVALAYCSQEEMLSIQTRHHPFDLLFTLCCAPVVETAPTQIPTAQTITEQLAWYYQADTMLYRYYSENMYLYLPYTSLVDDPDTPGASLPKGQLLYHQAYQAVDQVGLRIIAYITTLSSQEQKELYEQMEELTGPEEPQPTPEEQLTQTLAEMPEHLTVENFFDYASELQQICFYMEMDYYDFALLEPEVQAHYLTLEQELQVVAGVYQDELFAKLDQMIAQICDPEQLSTRSELYLALIEEDICWALAQNIDVMRYFFGTNTYSKLQNLELFCDYYRQVTGHEYYYDDVTPPDEFWIHGDLNLDYEIDAVDALMTLQYAVNTITLPPYAIQAADVNGDQTVDALDALLILQFAVSLIHSFPAMFAK